MDKQANKRSGVGVKASIHKLGGKVNEHDDFGYMYRTLFADDGIHLSFMGNDIFINVIQSASTQVCTS